MTMNFTELPPEVGRAAPGFLGSALAWRWLAGSWKQKLGMVAAGVALSWYAGQPMSRWLQLDVALTGFLLGLFGMACVDKVFAVINAVDAPAIAAAAKDKLIRVFGG